LSRDDAATIFCDCAELRTNLLLVCALLGGTLVSQKIVFRNVEQGKGSKHTVRAVCKHCLCVGTIQRTSAEEVTVIIAGNSDRMKECMSTLCEIFPEHSDPVAMKVTGDTLRGLRIVVTLAEHAIDNSSEDSVFNLV